MVPGKQNELLRILITGANGFVGRHLIAFLLGEAGEAAENGSLPSRMEQTAVHRDVNHDETHHDETRDVRIIAGVHFSEISLALQEPVRSFDAAGWSGGTADGRIEIVGVELADAERLNRLVAETQPHRIYHLAARSSGADTDRAAVFAANVQGTRNLLEAAAQLNPFPRVLLASTGYVYGNTDSTRPACEEDPIGPLWRYGAYTDSKIEMEAVARAYRGFAVVTRSFAHTGPGQSPDFAVPGFARQLARIESGFDPPELRVGNLAAWRDLLDVRDVVRAYSLLMDVTDWRSITGRSYNVATGNPVEIRAVVDRLCVLSEVQPEIIVDPDRLRPLDIACSTGDSTRLRAATDWRPHIPLDRTLAALMTYWRLQTYTKTAQTD